MSKSPVRCLLSLLAACALAPAALAQTAPPYAITASTALGAPDHWDYLLFDPESARVYISHGDRVAVVDSHSAAVLGQIQGMPGGTHGIGISHATGLGFTDDGRTGEVDIFDPASLAVKTRLKAAPDADGIVFDVASGHVFIIEGDSAQVQVVDPATQSIIATIPGGGGLEFGVSDGQGHVYVNGEANHEIVRFDSRSNTVDGRWPMPSCVSPHGLAMDVAHHRLFSGCSNSQMIVLDSDTGAVVATLPIGRGSDAIAFDPKRQRVFSPNGADGTLSIYQETSADAYALLATLPTAVSGRTMTLDPDTGRLYIAAADTDPNPTPGGRAKVRPGTLKLLVLDPTN